MSDCFKLEYVPSLHSAFDAVCILEKVLRVLMGTPEMAITIERDGKTMLDWFNKSNGRKVRLQLMSNEHQQGLVLSVNPKGRMEEHWTSPYGLEGTGEKLLGKLQWLMEPPDDVYVELMNLFRTTNTSWTDGTQIPVSGDEYCKQLLAMTKERLLLKGCGVE